MSSEVRAPFDGQHMRTPLLKMLEWLNIPTEPEMDNVVAARVKEELGWANVPSPRTRARRKWPDLDLDDALVDDCYKQQEYDGLIVASVVVFRALRGHMVSRTHPRSVRLLRPLSVPRGPCIVRCSCCRHLFSRGSTWAQGSCAHISPVAVRSLRIFTRFGRVLSLLG